MLMGKFHSSRILCTKKGQYKTVEKTPSHSWTEAEISLGAGRWKTSNPETCEVGGNLSIFMSSGLVPH